MSQSESCSVSSDSEDLVNNNQNLPIEELVSQVKGILEGFDDDIIRQILLENDCNAELTIDILLSEQETPKKVEVTNEPQIRFPDQPETTTPPTQLSEEDKLSEEAIKKILKEEEEEWQRLQRKREEEERKNEELTRKLLEEERQKREDELKKKRYICTICYSNDKKDTDLYILDECNHRFCRDCLREFFTTKINNGEVTSIKCPIPECKHLVTYNEVKHLVNRRTFDKYEEFLLKYALDTDPNCRYCPRPGCGNAMFGDPNLPMMVCSNEKCRFTFCFNCREEWHADTTCEKYQEWKRENNDAENRFVRWAAEHTKQCPNCHTKIEKNGGCNHMTCSKCRYEFCWLCLNKYTSGHFSPNGCKQYS